MTDTPKMEDVIEPVVQAFKDELEATGLFDEIDEGENIYEGSGMKAMVLPGPDTIRNVGMQKLEHQILLYVIILSGEEDTTPTILRKEMYPAYDALMADLTHDGTCFVALPTLWSPGFLEWSGKTYVGVLSNWMVRVYQTYTPTGA